MSQISRFNNLNQAIESLVGNDGIIVPPFYDGTRWDIFVLGNAAHHIHTTGNIALSTLTIDLDGGIADTYTTDAGAANPINYILEVLGGSNINTAAPLVPGNRIVINLDDNVHITGTFTADGDISTTAGNINLPNTVVTGTAGVITFGGNPYIHNYGTDNFFLGNSAGDYAVTMTGQRNIALGRQALTVLTSGDDNTMVGDLSGLHVSTGSTNTALGSTSLGALTTGDGNLGLGAAAGGVYTVESDNVCIGNIGVIGDANIIRLGTDGSGAGEQTDCYIAGTTHITRHLAMPDTNVGGTVGIITFGGFPYISNYGTDNFFLGNTSGGDAVTLTGARNTCLGRGGLQNLTTGDDNASLGDVSLVALTTGSNNTAAGSGSLGLLTTGDDNIAIGFASGGVYTVESSNICIANVGTVADANIIRLGTDGNGAGQQTDCYIAGNTRVTRNLMLPNTSAAGTEGEIQFNGSRWISNYGTNNTFVGPFSGNTTLTVANATRNSALGYSALGVLTTGSHNTALGETSGFAIDAGSYNLSAGSDSLSSLTSGSNNVALGAQALNHDLTGSNNIALGYQAGNAYTGAESSNICIGNIGVIADGNTIRIGTQGAGAGQQDTTFVAGIRGVAPVTTDAGVVLIASDHQLGSTGAMTDGQLVIGSTGANPVLGTITAGNGIAITNGAGSITIDSLGITWTVEAVNLAGVVNHGYFSNKAGRLDVSLPAVSAVGDALRIANISGTAIGWRITQAAGQQIRVGTSTSTLGAAGYIEATQIGDAVELICSVANTDWVAVNSPQGNITIA